MSDSQERIVYCRQLDPDTILHLTVFGENYVLRRFDGTHPFTAEDKPSYDELRVCYNFPLDRPLDDEEARHPVTDEEWWREHLAKLNRELLGDLREAG